MQKKKTARSKKYLEFIRKRPCVLTGLTHEMDNVIHAHHVRCLGGGGVNLKPSDFQTVPLTAQAHARLHHIGERTFWEQAGILPEEMVKMNLLIYLAQEKDLDWKYLMGFIESLS